MDNISDSIKVLDFYDEEAVKEYVIRALQDRKPQWFVHYDHGSEYVMWGDDEKPIIDLSNLGKLAGTHVYCMNCSSGKGLGVHAVEKGILEYLGYNGVVSFTTDAIDEFGSVFNYGIVKAMEEEKWLKDVVEPMRENGYQVADQLLAEGKVLGSSCMVKDMNILHVYHKDGPEPPDPECWFSRQAKRTFGWNGLWFLRMLRQKLWPRARYILR